MKAISILIVITSLGVLPACTTATLHSIAPTPGGSLALGQPASFDVKGAGRCGMMTIDFGDGSAPVDVSGATLDANPSPTVTHTYPANGWGGGKKVKAKGVVDCFGEVQTQVKILPETKIIGFVPNATSACGALTTLPPLRVRTLVHASVPSTNPLPEIDFGCAFGGCHHNLMGSGLTAPSDFSFPGLVAHSMILRVGTQVVQGPTSPAVEARFTTTQAGPLEICVNDSKLDDNTGGWGVVISIDELGPLP
jgi:hypothetical protein